MAHAPKLVTLKSGGQTINHPCAVCGAEASFGSGVCLRKGRLGIWHCAVHLPRKAAAIAQF